MQVRQMDDFFALEHYLGAVTGVVSLQYGEDALETDPKDIVYHEFPKPEAIETT